MHTAHPVSAVPPAYLFARHWPTVLVHGLLSLLLGMAAITLPLATAGHLSRLFGMAAVIEGLLILLAGHARYRLLPTGVALALALPCIAIGVLAAAWPQQLAGTMLLVVAAWLVLAGVYRILAGMRMQRAAGSSWLLLCSGLLTVAMGAILALHPITGLAVALAWFGLLAVPAGLLQLSLAIHLWRQQPVRQPRH